MGRKTLSISDVFLPMIFGKNSLPCIVSENGLPDDAKIVNAQVTFYGTGHQTLVLLMESSEWEGPADGDRYPEINVTFTQATPDAVEALYLLRDVKLRGSFAP